MLVAGVDEAGRGPLAGPVVAAAVILNPNSPIENLKDSKLLSAKKREYLFEQINNQALAVSWSSCSVIEIDSINILQASLLAMRKAILNLKIMPNQVLVDGNILPNLSGLVVDARAIIKGDQLEPAISAASIIAKVIRDRLMLELDQKYPIYGFAKHKGYGTKEHVAALKQYGQTIEHRNSFLKKILICNESNVYEA
jgi:ribonuclease HII